MSPVFNRPVPVLCPGLAKTLRHLPGRQGIALTKLIILTPGNPSAGVASARRDGTLRPTLRWWQPLKRTRKTWRLIQSDIRTLGITYLLAPPFQRRKSCVGRTKA